MEEFVYLELEGWVGNGGEDLVPEGGVGDCV